MCTIRRCMMTALACMCMAACDKRAPVAESPRPGQDSGRRDAAQAHSGASEQTHTDSSNAVDHSGAANIAVLESVLAHLHHGENGKNHNLAMYEKALALARSANDTNVAWLEQAVAYFSNIMVDIPLLTPEELAQLDEGAKTSYAERVATKCLARGVADDKAGVERYSRYLIDNGLIEYVAASSAADVFLARAGLNIGLNGADREACVEGALRAARKADDATVLRTYMTLACITGSHTWYDKAYALAQDSQKIDADTRQSISIAATSERHATASAKAQALRRILPSLDRTLTSYNHARRLLEFYEQEAAAERRPERGRDGNTTTVRPTE